MNEDLKTMIMENAEIRKWALHSQIIFRQTFNIGDARDGEGRVMKHTLHQALPMSPQTRYLAGKEYMVQELEAILRWGVFTFCFLSLWHPMEYDKERTYYSPAVS